MGKFLSWLQEHTKHWTKPATSTLISSVLSDLVVENALLRQQLIVLKRQIKRPQLTGPDRFRLVFLSPSRNSGNNHSYGLRTSTEGGWNMTIQ
jgi:hypothetical protein